ncbi:IS630 family transposase [Metallosphaera javensis (ex Sakai et al. 2022)]|uniref:IS630 family transposase n=2 Tax=Metallosphaera javensis (ex Sakai et al. 2022) TaxID=2775498 RepID=UPI00258D5087|nr:MAG: hypothetical protein MjAS7_0014 [Metallosphaera javensis (ex Sakai et al. 2022)]BCS91447.1 MAG: hypothetical protein MjAS7_0055 [Metallosphaera javensis (ex Sakai et al. 2022)]BCS91574.1 MAG: hypothetical protein MjAS7_0182 [Metallosphaera javensis (ex Sakai et al. 2022)]BCS92216.1 MAG: hypothetical protein MjAS7_0824 [Metallosphaera javensis (ex Sakai et al. 2022)]BCS92465.1 MAG: hypothetical protein MjAS7_1073 [Metallosphaera javensis (ex Sakai et al. 2022)]
MGRRIAFFDETRVVVGTTVRRCLARRGSRPRIRVNLGFQHFYVFLALDAISRKVLYTLYNSLSSKNMKSFVYRMERKWGRETKYLVLDNHSSHKTGAILDLFRRRGVRPVFTPKYSPELNPVERIFKDLKFHLANRFFNNVEEAREEVRRFFEEHHDQFNLDVVQYLDLDEIEVENNG